MSEKTKKRFITNSASHYFVVEDKVDVSKLYDCLLHETLEEMYCHLCTKGNFKLEEVECMELTLRNNLCINAHGGSEEINTSLETFINKYRE